MEEEKKAAAGVDWAEKAPAAPRRRSRKKSAAKGKPKKPAATAEPTAAVTAAPAEETVEREYIECSGGYAYTEFVPMDDGAEICLLIVKPEKEGQFPTVITQNCYQAATEEFNAE